MTDDNLHDLDDVLDELDIDAPPAADGYTRKDYIAVDGYTRVSVFTFGDGSSLKAWTSDDGENYTTRDINVNGLATLGSTRKGLSEDDVIAIVAERGGAQ